MQNPVEASPLPDGVLLQRYRDMPGAYTDCFSVSIDRAVSGREFIEAFYTTGLFKCERFVLFLIGRGTTDAIVRALAAGEVEAFAAWTVEGRASNEILVCDFMRLTRSWLMAGPHGNGTRLHFGTAAVPTSRNKTGEPRPGLWFRLLFTLHVVYAKALLRAAANKVTPQAR
ncbi:MAG: hypothetical protein QM773_16195 [Hyphomonadaceae bacterium]